MSLSHLFVSYIHETERDDMSYFSDDKELLLETRKKLIFVLSTTPELTEEYKLLGSIARRCLFDFDRYANNVIHDMTMFAKVPLTDKEKTEFIRYLADLIPIIQPLVRQRTWFYVKVWQIIGVLM
jgi:hypothetical protein